jgi:putative ABC transport system permease protein
MRVSLRHIFAALSRNRFGPVLVALQVAVALAVLVNAACIVKQRLERINRPTGMDVENIFVIASAGFASNFDLRATMRQDLDYLRSVPGVVAATPMNVIPLSGEGRAIGVQTDPGPQRPFELANTFQLDAQGLRALGVAMKAGRFFREDEILPPTPAGQSMQFVPQVIVTDALAQALFPGQNALGRTIYGPNAQPATIIGILARMHGSWIDVGNIEHVLLQPRLPSPPSGPMYYVVRTEPGQQDRVMRQAEEHLALSNIGRVIEWMQPLERIRARTYSTDRSTATFLAAITVLLLSVAALGVFGLGTFNVTRRTRQIGARRALGARRVDIVRHFMVENVAVTGVGALLGALLGVAFGFALTKYFGQPRLDLWFLAGGILIVSILGQVSAWQPARRAAKVPPSIATRTV